MELVAKLQDVGKRFGNRQVLNALNFEVQRGEAVALLGPNGAGKSTALSILQGQRSPTSGKVELFGSAPGTPAAMRRMGVTPQDAEFPPQVTPRELIAFAGAHYPTRRSDDELTELFGLEKLMDRHCAGFSGGERRRVALALAMVGNPELVLFDEPTTGLDTGAQENFKQVARRHVDEGGALILTSHNLEEVEHVCSRIALIDNGRVVLSGSISEIRDAVAMRTVSFKAEALPDRLRTVFSHVGDYWTATLRHPEKLLAELFVTEAKLQSLTVENLPLDQAIAHFQSENQIQNSGEKA